MLAWDSSELIPVEIAGQKPRHLGNVLYYLPARLAIRGSTTFRSDLLRSTVVEADAVLFSKDPSSINFGRGTVTMAYRPIGFEGRLTATELAIGMNFGETGTGRRAGPGQAAGLDPAGLRADRRQMIAFRDGFDGVLAEVELFDIETGTWQRLPHLQSGMQLRGAIPRPATSIRRRGPSSSASSTRRPTSVGFSVDLSITGDVE